MASNVHIAYRQHLRIGLIEKGRQIQFALIPQTDHAYMDSIARRQIAQDHEGTIVGIQYAAAAPQATPLMNLRRLKPRSTVSAKLFIVHFLLELSFVTQTHGRSCVVVK